MFKSNFAFYICISENDTDFWIGANADTDKGHKFHWVDGSELSYRTYNNWGNNLMGKLILYSETIAAFLSTNCQKLRRVMVT